MAAGIFSRFTAAVRRIKAHHNYNDSIGEQLRIVGDEQALDRLTLKPVLTIVLDSGRPIIKWKKGPHADGLKLFVDRTNSGNFTLLAIDMEPDYMDTTALPAGVNSAIWKYKAIYVLGDEEAGQHSEVAAITVTRNI